MKFREILRFELAYQLRRPWPWLAFIFLALFSFFNMREAMLPATLSEEFVMNSPFVIAAVSIFSSMVWLLIAPALAGEAGARDAQTGLHPLMYTLPVTRREYLGGRFTAAFVLNLLALSGVQAGMLLAPWVPGIPPEFVGPFRPEAYIAAFALIAMPNAFIATTAQFSIALLSGRALTAYFASIFLLFFTVPVPILLFFGLGQKDLALLADPIGMMAIMNEMMSNWTIIEKNVRMFSLTEPMIANRAIWLGLAVATLALVWHRFRFEHRADADILGRFMARFRRRPPVRADAVPASVQVPYATQTFGFGTRVRQTVAIATLSFRSIATSWPGLFMLVAFPAFVVLVLLSEAEQWGIRLLPRTGYVVSKHLTSAITEVSDFRAIVPLLIIYFAGELVWRERDAGLSENVDATATPEWVMLIGKFLGLGMMLALFLVGLAASHTVAQAITGYVEFRPDLLLSMLFGFQLVEYLLFAMLAFAIHVVVNEKYAGMLVALTLWLLMVFSGVVGVEHGLFVYSKSPGWSYTDIRGFGGSAGPWLWFKLYWAGWAVLLAVGARLFWARGRDGGWRARVRAVRRRLTPATIRTAAFAGLLVLLSGGFIFYNTNIRNDYISADRLVEMRADYERRYGHFEGKPQPVVVATGLRIEIYPERNAALIRGSYRLTNPYDVAIDSIHVEPALRLNTDLTFDRRVTRVVADEELGHFVYALAEPLAPGGEMILSFEVAFEPRGFTNSGNLSPVIANGTHFTANALPGIGYQPGRELWGADDRRKHGLPRQLTVVPPGDINPHEAATPPATFEAVIGTAADQIAVAPGELRRTWTEGDRRYFHYASNVPIGGTEFFFSARYEVHREQWNGVDVQLYVHPGHAMHAERVLRSVRASLDWMSSQFGEYPYPFLQVVEQPGNFMGMGVDGGGLITGGEGFFLLDPQGNGFDMIFEIVAHEMGHQWWGAQLNAAFAEGGGILSEGLAWYSAIQLVKNVQGPEAARRFLRLMRQPVPWPPMRSGYPLLRAMDPWANYRKAPYAFYALSEYIGAERVNGALRRLIENQRGSLATTLDMYRELQAATPDSMQYLLRDLFEVDTYWELAADEVNARRTEGGEWEVTMNVRARKMVADSAGVETERVMDEWIPVGVFGERAPGSDELSNALYMRMHRIRSGEQTITVTVRERPVLAGIDPFHLLDWVEGEDDDNIEAVALPGDTGG